MDLIKEQNVFYNIFCFLITENGKYLERPNSRLYWQTVYHSLALLHHVYVGLYAMTLDIDGYEDDHIQLLRKYGPFLLTGWGFLFQTTFLFMSVVYDTLQWAEKHETEIGKRLKYWTDVIFSSLVVPITMFVTGMFWSVYAIDRELVFPQVYDQIVPWWFNHCVHTNISIVIAVETILVARRKPVNAVLETSLVAGVTVLYAVVYYTIYFLTHRWLYGVFGVMTWWQVCLFQSFIWAISYVFYRIQYPINRLFHSAVPEIDSNESAIQTLGKMNATKSDIEGRNDFSNKGFETDIEGTKDFELNGDFKEGKRRNSNSPIFANKTWSKKYRDLRDQFEKTKL